jgi:hypothetical protein
VWHNHCVWKRKYLPQVALDFSNILDFLSIDWSHHQIGSFSPLWFIFSIVASSMCSSLWCQRPSIWLIWVCVVVESRWWQQPSSEKNYSDTICHVPRKPWPQFKLLLLLIWKFNEILTKSWKRREWKRKEHFHSSRLFSYKMGGVTHILELKLMQIWCHGCSFINFVTNFQESVVLYGCDQLVLLHIKMEWIK